MFCCRYFPWYNEMAAVMPSSQMQLSDETDLPMDDSGFLPVVEKSKCFNFRRKG